MQGIDGEERRRTDISYSATEVKMSMQFCSSMEVETHGYVTHHRALLRSYHTKPSAHLHVTNITTTKSRLRREAVTHERNFTKVMRL